MKYLEGMIEILPDGSVISKFKDKIYSISSEARIIGGDVGFEIESGTLRFGRSERTMFFKDASKIERRPSRSLRGQITTDPAHNMSTLTPGVSEPYFTGGGRMDFDGTIAGQHLIIKDLQYSSTTTAIESDGFSVGIGKSNGGPASIKIGSMLINPRK